MSQPDLKTLLDGAVSLSKEAGQRIMTIYNQDFSIVQKDDNSPVTEADMAAHALIDDGLEELAPEYPMLSEESASIPFEDRARWEYYWLVDPLDGTREFIKRNGEFTVNIALIHQHRAILGVVYAPALSTCYYAAQGLGAFKQQGEQAAVPIQVQSRRHDKVIVAGSRSHRGESLNRFLDKLGDYELLSMGSALKSCLVAEGAADIYPRLGPTSEWDTAAAHCIVEEAGGRLTNMDMQDLPYNTKESLLNPHFFVFGDNSVDWSKYL
ncbi:MAG: 3'(2'),5'-bisphosphate nucleotidase CysQ [Gammaproteobacteria bacterium]